MTRPACSMFPGPTPPCPHPTHSPPTPTPTPPPALRPQGMGATPAVVGADARALVNVVQARGLGYAMASEEELRTVQSVAATTGVILDPVYSGKAVHAMLQVVGW